MGDSKLTSNTECKFDEKTRIMLTKSLEDLNNMTKFMEEFTGLVHHMVLHLYKETKIPLPENLKDYRFRNKNPWGESD